MSRRTLRLVAIAAVLITVAYAVAGAVGQRAADQQQQAEAIAAEDAAAEAAGTPRTGAARDPSAQGEPVAPRDDAAGPRDAAWCSAEDSTLMFGDPDAATGHRMIALRMVNGADKPCVLNGYPDILFADQNGHQLDVTVEHGGSFMVQDPGAAPITIEPGAWAVSYIGWNANSTHGELVATEVYSAMVPGDERHPWPPQAPFDIIPGSTVAVTAWAPDEGPQPAD